MHKILVRSASGIVYIALIVGTLFAGWPWFAALMLMFLIIATSEYQHLVAVRQGTYAPWVSRTLDMIIYALTLLTPVCIMWAASLPITDESGSFEDTLGMLCVVVLAVCFAARFIFALRSEDQDPFANMAYSMLGWFYLAVPLTMLVLLQQMVPKSAVPAVLPMFVLIWLNDTGAFCVGSMIGFNKLCERLSPKKTWEGFWGGFGFCIVASVIYAVCMDQSALAWAVFGAVVSITATWGDLFESMLKRTAGVKDAGHIMPGHGGVLDRIDSLLFVVPLATIFYVFTLAN